MQHKKYFFDITLFANAVNSLEIEEDTLTHRAYIYCTKGYTTSATKGYFSGQLYVHIILTNVK